MEAISLLGNLFKLDGETHQARQPAPARGEHTREVLSTLPSLALEPDVTT